MKGARLQSIVRPWPPVAIQGALGIGVSLLMILAPDTLFGWIDPAIPPSVVFIDWVNERHQLYELIWICKWSRPLGAVGLFVGSALLTLALMRSPGDPVCLLRPFRAASRRLYRVGRANLTWPRFALLVGLVLLVAVLWPEAPIEARKH